VNCPIDGTLLVMTERSGVEIDYCPQCRGVWLDRGELDKLIVRAERNVFERVPSRTDDRYESRDRYESGDRYDDHRFGGKRKKKRESFLSEIFDFG
jgi:Zn-finger nucleic acid-binding protein